jgi:hypothetical protein
MDQVSWWINVSEAQLDVLLSSSLIVSNLSHGSCFGCLMCRIKLAAFLDFGNCGIHLFSYPQP